MRKPFISRNFKAPQKADLGDYYLTPISTKDVIEDWQVLLDNAEMISRLRRGGSRQDWPFKCSLEENYKDLAWLELCAKYHQLFCYILRSKEDNSYCGAVYIYPIETFYPEMARKYDVDFSFWITKKEYLKGAYERIFKDLFNWLVKDWPFGKKRIYLRNKEIPKSLK